MTRTDVMASSRPQTPSTAPDRRGSSSVLRGLSALTVALLTALAIMVPGAAVAAEPTSGYGQTPSTSTTTPTPTTGTLPAKEAEKPTPTTAEKEPAPAKASSEPSKAKATTLPFTGFDLRWDLGLGVLLMGAGFSIVAVQRRQRRDS
jgi:hypothetical protein